MKLPLAVEAKVTDELRTWLASELEQLDDASSTNQFAHHVVTILLHEDLDIEDEPLTSGDDFLKDIFSMKQTKTRDKQKKAAVQFLRSAVSCDGPVDASIQMLVEQLMQKIDATKVKMQSRKPSKRSLLTPLAVNVGSPPKKNGVKNSIGANEQCYNEAFPSLSGDESPSKGGAASAATTFSWSRSPGAGKENLKKKVRRRIGSRCTWLFRSPEEALACDIARETAAMVLEDLSFSAKEAMEVWAPSQISSAPLTDPPTFCWKSAFHRTSFMTKPFSPSTAPLQSLKASGHCASSARYILPVILGDKSYTMYPECPHMDALSNWERMGFLPVSHSARWKAREQKKMTRRPLKGPVSLDGEVRYYLCSDDGKRKDHLSFEDCQKPEVATFDEEIEGPVSFPTHYGSYWQNLISEGAISLYPPFVVEQEEEDNRIGTWTSLQDQNYLVSELEDSFRSVLCQLSNDADIGPVETEDQAKDISDDVLSSSLDLKFLFSEEDSDEGIDVDIQDWTDSGNADSQYNVGAGSLLPWAGHSIQGLPVMEKLSGSSRRQELICHQYDSAAWDSPWYPTEWSDINQDILADLMGTKKKTPNPYLPPRLASCVTSEHSQFLQSAFVNAFFSSPHLDVYSQAWKAPVNIHQKAYFLSFSDERQLIKPRIWPVELVKGTTCSNWLENNCKLGLLCPFSHPSV